MKKNYQCALGGRLWGKGRKNTSPAKGEVGHVSYLVDDMGEKFPFIVVLAEGVSSPGVDATLVKGEAEVLNIV